MIAGVKVENICKKTFFCFLTVPTELSLRVANLLNRMYFCGYLLKGWQPQKIPVKQQFKVNPLLYSVTIILQLSNYNTTFC